MRSLLKLCISLTLVLRDVPVRISMAVIKIAAGEERVSLAYPNHRLSLRETKVGTQAGLEAETEA